MTVRTGIILVDCHCVMPGSLHFGMQLLLFAACDKDAPFNMTLLKCWMSLSFFKVSSSCTFLTPEMLPCPYLFLFSSHTANFEAHSVFSRLPVNVQMSPPLNKRNISSPLFWLSVSKQVCVMFVLYSAKKHSGKQDDVLLKF